MKNHQNKRKTPTKLPLTKEDACSYGFILRMHATGQLPVSSTKKVPGQWTIVTAQRKPFFQQMLCVFDSNISILDLIFASLIDMYRPQEVMDVTIIT